MTGTVYAHSLSGHQQNEWESLAAHGAAVAERAAGFADAFGWGEVLRLAGRLHDIGKLSPDFQAYLSGARNSGGDHSSAGARIALDHYGPMLGTILAAIIAGHHAGLADGEELARRMAGARHLVPPRWENHTGPLPAPAALGNPPRPKAGDAKGFATSFLIRMLFSALVDADFLATEAFYAKATGAETARGGHTALATLKTRLDGFMREKRAAAAPTPLNVLRAEILDHALSKAPLEPGLFRLTVPTGGGKTLTSLSFALDHAVRHGLRRVIYVIPYSSIIEQTAAVFRTALATQDDILEHHASFDWERARGGQAADDEAPSAVAKLRRAAENWDAPIIVTTAVQFFESLFAERPSRCRKLHNIVGSVVVLDEVQTLPLPLLLPSLAAIEQLALNYRTSLVLCTATQPALRASDEALHDKIGKPLGLKLDDERELAPDPQRLHESLRRVSVERREEPVSDAEIAARFAEQPQLLVIVNTRRHAAELFKAIAALPGAVHLSTLMCARHRRLVLDRLRAALKAGEPVRLVATSLIEAGVDIDFPEVWRAASGLDSIAQAAGRANREGRLRDAAGRPRLGRVVIFEPAEADTRQGDLTMRRQAARSVYARHADPLSLPAIKEYFAALYWQKEGNTDTAFDATMVGGYPGILRAIAEAAPTLGFPFRQIGRAFRMIDEEGSEPVVVPWRADADDDDADRLLKRIAAMERPLAADLRRLQHYVVPIPQRARDEWLARGVLVPVHAGLGEAMLRFTDDSLYRPQTGIDLENTTYREPSLNQM